MLVINKYVCQIHIIFNSSDLTPRNLLIDEKGNLLLTYMCNFREKVKLFSNKYENKFYCAPEAYGLQHVTFAADWWSYGSILFELLTGMV